MTKKDLQRFRKLKIELQSIQNQIAGLDAKIKRATPSYSTQPRGGKSPDNADKIIKLVELKEDYEKKEINILTEQKTIEDAIAKLDDPVEAAVIRYRYIELLEWPDIQVAICYERSKVFQIHASAIKKLLKI